MLGHPVHVVAFICFIEFVFFLFVGQFGHTPQAFFLYFLRNVKFDQFLKLQILYISWFLYFPLLFGHFLKLAKMTISMAGETSNSIFFIFLHDFLYFLYFLYFFIFCNEFLNISLKNIRQPQAEI